MVRIDFYFFLPVVFIEGNSRALAPYFHESESSGRTVRRRASAGRPASCRTMKCQGPLLAASGGDATPHVLVEATFLQILILSLQEASRCPHAPVQPPMVQSIPASTPTAEEDGAMNDAQQVFEELPTRLCSSLFQS
jgi:hypothetical protein